MRKSESRTQEEGGGEEEDEDEDDEEEEQEGVSEIIGDRAKHSVKMAKLVFWSSKGTRTEE